MPGILENVKLWNRQWRAKRWKKRHANKKEYEYFSTWKEANKARKKHTAIAFYISFAIVAINTKDMISSGMGFGPRLDDKIGSILYINALVFFILNYLALQGFKSIFIHSYPKEFLMTAKQLIAQVGDQDLKKRWNTPKLLQWINQEHANAPHDANIIFDIIQYKNYSLPALVSAAEHAEHDSVKKMIIRFNGEYSFVFAMSMVTASVFNFFMARIAYTSLSILFSKGHFTAISAVIISAIILLMVLALKKGVDFDKSLKQLSTFLALSILLVLAWKGVVDEKMINDFGVLMRLVGSLFGKP